MTGKRNVREDEEKWEGVINGGERENSLCPSVHCDQQEGASSSLSLLLLPKVKGRGGGVLSPRKNRTAWGHEPKSGRRGDYFRVFWAAPDVMPRCFFANVFTLAEISIANRNSASAVSDGAGLFSRLKGEPSPFGPTPRPPAEEKKKQRCHPRTLVKPEPVLSEP